MFKYNQKKLLVAGGGLFLVMVCLSCRFYFDTTKEQFTSPKTTASFERGRNLVYTLCAGCHFDNKTQKFTGRSLNDLPKIAGHLYSANLTHSSVNGTTGNYSDAELFYLFKRGIAKSGKFMPYMMKPMMADDDINDMIIFLRSDDPALAADDTSPGKTTINFIGRAGIRFLMGPQPYNKGVPRPDENNPVVYGRYLVSIIGCYHCHSRKTTGLDFLNAENTKGYLQGGIKLKDPKGNRIYAPNLTPDKETGIGYYTKEEFRDAVRKGISPSGAVLSPPMDKFDQLSDKQSDAIYAYLLSLPPVSHKVKPPHRTSEP
jgi:mono/diheme cytochrome c family protein